MESKNFLFVSWDGLIGDLAWQIIKEGHSAKYYIKSKADKEVADGFVPKVDEWEPEVAWADVIIFDDVLGQGTVAQKLRAQGKKVVGGTPYTDRLEDDRSFGQEEFKRHDVPIIPYQEFTSFDDAIAFVQQNPGRYVIKPSGKAQNIKGLLFVGEEEDGRDVIQVLRDYQQAWAKKIPVFQLQKRITGVEIAVGAFFNGREFIYPVNINFENKKLFPGDLGPSTGEMGCYDDQTEVLTDHGWRLFKNLTALDTLCTLNPKTHIIEYHKPTMLTSFKHHRTMVQIKNQTLDICVTPDHNMYVCPQQKARKKQSAFQFVKAKDLEFQSVIKRTGNWRKKEQKLFALPSAEYGHYEGRAVRTHRVPNRSILMDDWLAFFGIWLSDGSVSQRGYSISIAQKMGAKRTRIAAFLKRFPFSFTEQEYQYVAHDKQLATYLQQFGKAPAKYVPDYIKQLPPRQIALFLDWFCLGDGTIMKNGGYRIFYTSSKHLADDIQELLLKIGHVGVIKKRKGRGRVWIKDHYANARRTQFEIHERVVKGDSWVDKRDIKTIPYNGIVYCATVKNHIMYVRRNGKPYWCGNTFMFWAGPNRLFNATLKKFEATLAQEGFVGYIDVNCIVNGNGIYPLEWTARFGYPTIYIQHEGMLSPIGEFMHALANGESYKLRVKSGFQVGARIVMPPFPFNDNETFEVKSKDTVIYFKNSYREHPEGVHIEDVKLVNGEWVVTGETGTVIVVCGTGATMKQAQSQMYSRIKNINIPHMYYRTDIGDRWFEDSDRLHNWGYLREI